MLDEVVHLLADEIRIGGHVVVGARQDQEVELLVFQNQRVDQPDGLAHGHVVVHRAVHDEQLALQVLRQRAVVVVHILVVEAVIALRPGVVVHALVVIARGGHAHLVHARILQHGAGGGAAAAGVAPDAQPLHVDERELLLQLVAGGNVILQAAHAVDVQIAVVVELLSAARRAHAVQNHAHEAQLCILLQAAEDLASHRMIVCERQRHVIGLCTAIDVIHHGVRLIRIEILRLDQDAVQVGDAVAGLDREPLRNHVAQRQQIGDVGLLQRADHMAVHVVQLRHRGHVHAGEGIHKPVAVAGDAVLGVLGRQHLKASAVEVHAAEHVVQRLGHAGHVHGHEVHVFVLLIHVNHALRQVFAGRDRVDERAGFDVVAEIVGHVVPLGLPHRIPAILRHEVGEGIAAEAVQQSERAVVLERLGGLAHQHAGSARLRVHVVQARLLVGAAAPGVDEALVVLHPLGHGVLIAQSQRARGHVAVQRLHRALHRIAQIQRIARQLLVGILRERALVGVQPRADGLGMLVVEGLDDGQEFHAALIQAVGDELRGIVAPQRGGNVHLALELAGDLVAVVAGGGVVVVLVAIERDLLLLAGFVVAQHQIVVADQQRAPSVRSGILRLLRMPARGQLAGFDVILIVVLFPGKAQLAVLQLAGVKRQGVLLQPLLPEQGDQLLVIEQRRLFAGLAIHFDESRLNAVLRADVLGVVQRVVVQPLNRWPAVEHRLFGMLQHQLARGSISLLDGQGNPS